MDLKLESKTVWRDEGESRYFLVPDAAELPSGNFRIRTTTGRRVETTEEVLAAFEISEAQANAWIKEQFGNFLDGLRGAAEDFISKINAATEKLRSSRPK